MHNKNRKGSKKGDLIFTTGPFGYTSIGLGILLGSNNKTSNFIKKSVNTVLRLEMVAMVQWYSMI